MKKALFVAVFLGFLVLPYSGQIARAQTFTPEQQSSLDAIKQELVDLLTQEIALLTSQINQIIATQATQQTQIDTVVQNTTPVVSAPVLGASTSTPGTSVSILPVNCNGAAGDIGESGVQVGVDITGPWSNWKITFKQYPQQAQHDGAEWYLTHLPQTMPASVDSYAKYRDGTYATYGFIPNFPATYQMTAHVYDQNGQEIATSPVTTEIVDCPASPNVKTI